MDKSMDGQSEKVIKFVKARYLYDTVVEEE